MEIGVDGSRGLIYAIGSCGYTGGLSVIDIGSGRIHLIGPPNAGPDGICGERVVVANGGLLAVARTARPEPNPSAVGALVLVDSKSGRSIMQAKLVAEPIDIAIL
jgi:hypothetical protein